jgi:hypothetical protein
MRFRSPWTLSTRFTGRPIFVETSGIFLKTSVRSTIMTPSFIVRQIIDRVRSLAQRAVFNLTIASFDLPDFLSNGDHRFAETVDLGL